MGCYSPWLTTTSSARAPFKFSEVPKANGEISLFVQCHGRLLSNVTEVDSEDRELFVGGDPGPMKSCPDGHHIADFNYVSGGHRSDLDVVIANGKRQEDDVVVHIQKDQSAITTQVFSKKNCTYGIAELLILIVALCRAKMHHVSRQ
ncbi:hypothetical protein T440DRAFT_492812 [Plenodomus tracheiphilus IPT5]|uniref:Uncharacterized protein n=1 Tax=Plenodomus tracheiphilus IPT5 TaxID=1408161 RepID=A0A6A7AW30_9PLEO|nr:hypothetical protein T440DRAFT_492812 [Plenodomus tracheiphilus IPT5]